MLYVYSGNEHVDASMLGIPSEFCKATTYEQGFFGLSHGRIFQVVNVINNVFHITLSVGGFE